MTQQFFEQQKFWQMFKILHIIAKTCNTKNVKNTK